MLNYWYKQKMIY